MNKKWSCIGLVVGLLFIYNSAVYANDRPEAVKYQEENEFLHFTPVSGVSLTDNEREFVNRNKNEQGLHQQGTLYLISLGEKPNSGYQLEFIKSKTTFEQEKIFVKQILPKEGQMYLQVIQSPYIIGRLKLPSKYMSVSIIDIDTNKGLFEIDQPNQPIDNDKIKVYLNGMIQSYDQPPILIGNRTMVPLRGIFESLGATVKYDGETQIITATKGELKVILKINSKTVSINGKTKTLDVPAIIQNNRTLVPLRFIGETLGADVSWDANQNTVFIKTEK